jgi:hypothetical protein
MAAGDAADNQSVIDPLVNKSCLVDYTVKFCTIALPWRVMIGMIHSHDYFPLLSGATPREDRGNPGERRLSSAQL